ncbi:MAG: transporter substrate-binding domain-containing protein [Peptoniphilus sp.]|uniref:transporter substrate-binding domain-containing protein n=1 Tax=Peptoniphilus sp. TaxID=1971214 RepID=UPI0025E8B190|nr:transporter substrate-binding domain-containing protein [Peptoniphilus sp.]MCI5643820.1 transporter substrate-binding domain-containing protein [Peptoniphilus sp.]MDD7353292.1 transporter substrate-binding domain-containing protein [Peptoniphilaceae bacterium]
MKKKIFNIAIIAMTVLFLFGCGKKEEKKSETKEKIKVEVATTGPTIDAIKEKGKIVLGTSADFPPMEWTSFQDGSEKYQGVDIALAQAIADSLGVKLEVKNMAFEGLLGSLKAGDVDMVLAGMGADDERKKQVDFSDEYSKGKQVLLVTEENKDKFKTFDDLNGKIIGTQLGSLQQKFATEKFGDNCKGFDLNNVIIEQLKNKSIDAAFLSELPAKQFASITDGLVIIDNLGIPDESGFAVAVKKGNDDLTKAVNEVIKGLKDLGQMEKWFDEYIELSNKEAIK